MILTFVLFFSPLITQAMPRGTILYKTGENGKMYGYNDFEFSLIPDQTNFGGVGIYTGKDKLNDNEPTIFEVDYSGVKRIPLKYFVDLDKGEKFIGAKIPIPGLFNGMTNQMYINILAQENEGFDFTYHKQKGPQPGDWTPAGFVEKIFESAAASQLAYHQQSVGEYPYYSVNITPDGYDDLSIVNKQGDVFSTGVEFSRIHHFGQGEFWEQFFDKKIDDFFDATADETGLTQEKQKSQEERKQKQEQEELDADLKKLSSIAKQLKDLIDKINIYGYGKDGNRYFFFPYTQFKQPTLMSVPGVKDSEVSSHGKFQAVGGFSLTKRRTLMAAAFLERLIYELAVAEGKKLVMEKLGLDKVLKGISRIREKIDVAEQGLSSLSAGAIEIDAEKAIGKTILSDYARASLSFKQAAKEFTQAGINESLEFFDLVTKGYLGTPEYERKMELELAKISAEDEKIIDTRPVIRQLGDVLEINPANAEEELEKRFKKLENKISRDVDLRELKELIGDLEVGPKNEKSPIKEDPPLKEPLAEIEKIEDNQSLEEKDEKIISPALTFQAGDLLINEAMPNPRVDEEEWIELYNNTGQRINLDSLTIEDNLGKANSLTNLTVSSRGFILLKQGRDFSFSLNNDGDTIKLKSQGVIIDAVTYGDFNDGNLGDNAPKPLARGECLARKKDGYDTDVDSDDWAITITPTPELANWIFTPSKSKKTESQQGSSISAGSAGTGAEEKKYQPYHFLDVVISEVAWMGTKANYNHEWLELYNNLNQAVDLSGWRLQAGDGSPEIILEGIMPAHTYRLLERSVDGTVANISANHLYVGTLDNDGEYLYLKDGLSNVIDELNFVSGWPAGHNETKSSMERIDFLKSGNTADNWQTHSGQDLYALDANGNYILGTPGRISSLPVVQNQEPAETDQEPAAESEIEPPILSYVSGEAIINEIMYDPAGADTGREWIEIYNAGGRDIDLNKWKFYEQDTNHKLTLKQGSLILPVGGYAIIAADADQFLLNHADFTGVVFDSSFSLHNTSEQIAIKDGQDNAINVVSYLSEWGGSGNDKTIEKQSSNDWTESQVVNGTPGKANSQPIIHSQNQESAPADTVPPVIFLIGEATVSLYLGDSYDDAGATAQDDINGDLTGDIVAVNPVNTNAAGVYVITYNVSDQAGNPAVQVIRTIVVQEAPENALPSSDIDTDFSNGFFNAVSLPETIGGSISESTEKVEIQIKRGEHSDYLDANSVWQSDKPETWFTLPPENLDKKNGTWSYPLPIVLLKQQDNKYFIRSRAIDVADKRQDSFSEVSFIFDNTPPEQILDLDIQADNLNLDLNWVQVGDNFSGLDHYEIEWNDSYATSTKNVLCRLDGENRTDYSFKVRACDKAGNCGKFSLSKQHRLQTRSLVISEVQTSGNEFVELYNPTDKDIDLTGWYFVYYSVNQNWGDTPWRLKRFPDNAKIRAGGYYLIGVYGFSELSVDWLVMTDDQRPYSLGQLSDIAGSVAIYSSNPKGKSSAMLKKQYIDAVGWGEAEFVKETTACGIAPEKNKSLERKQNQDTDDNARDFSLQSELTPENSRGRWLTNWNERRFLIVDNKENSNNLTDYAVKIEVSYQEGMQPDFSDVRFTTQNGVELLPYYREEEYEENQSAIFWVKIPSIPKYSEVAIYQYYGNPSAVYEGDGKDVFVWFDDFSSGDFSAYESHGVEWKNDGSAKIFDVDISGGDLGYLNPKDLEIKDFYLKAKMSLYRLSGGDFSFSPCALIDYRRSDAPDDGDEKNNNHWRFKHCGKFSNQSEGNLRLEKVVNGTLNRLDKVAIPNDKFKQWGVYEIKAYKTSHEMKYTPLNQIEEYKEVRNFVSNYLNQSGKIYLLADNVKRRNEGRTIIDYLIIAKHTRPEPAILEKNEGYIPSVSSREPYAEFPDWAERKFLIVSNIENANDLDDYSVKVEVDYQEGMQPDFSDVRFTASDQRTLLSYYREEYQSERSAIFWVKIPSIPKYSEVAIYQYYGNPSAVYEGDGKDVFVWFDDFSSGDFSDYEGLGGAWGPDDNVRIFDNDQADGNYGYLSPKNVNIQNFYLKTKMFSYRTDSDLFASPCALIDYRRSDTPNDGDGKDDNFWRFKHCGEAPNTSDGNLRLEKTINGALNRLEKIVIPKDKLKQWSIYEIKTYETSHQMKFTSLAPSGEYEESREFTSHYLNRPGRIYLLADDVHMQIGGRVVIDYLIIAKHTRPEPNVLKDKTEGYAVKIFTNVYSYNEMKGWDQRKEVVIDNTIAPSDATSTPVLVDYPIKVEVEYVAGMQSDFSDVRFGDSALPNTALAYWNESYIESTSAIFWVKIPLIPSNAQKTIYLYYDNPSAVYIGKGEDVFIWFDDFETNRYTEYDFFNTNWDRIINGYLRTNIFPSAYLAPRLEMSRNFDQENIKNFYLKTRMLLHDVKRGYINYRYIDANNYWHFGLDNKESHGYNGAVFGESQFDFWFSNTGRLYNTWAEFELWVYENTHQPRFTDQNGITRESLAPMERDFLADKAGKIYLMVEEVKWGTEAEFDYLIIGKYEQPKLTVEVAD